MPSFKFPPPPPEVPPPPDPAAPLNIFRKLVSNTKAAMESAKKGMRNLGEEIKKPFDRY